MPKKTEKCNDDEILYLLTVILGAVLSKVIEMDRQVDFSSTM